jgi:hypothetical protein
MAERGVIRSSDTACQGQRFFDFHESKGWIIGKSPMKDWRAAVRTWEINYRPSTTPEPTGGEGWKPYVKPEYN